MHDEHIIKSGKGDTIKSPNHYKGRYGIETIEVIENFTDDLAVLLLAYKTVSSAITPQIEQRAKERLLHSRKKDKKS